LEIKLVVDQRNRPSGSSVILQSIQYAKVFAAFLYFIGSLVAGSIFLVGTIIKLICPVIEFFIAGSKGERITDSTDEKFQSEDDSVVAVLNRLDTASYFFDIFGTFFFFLGIAVVTTNATTTRALFVLGSMGYVTSSVLTQFKIDRQSEGRQPNEKDEEEEEEEETEKEGSSSTDNLFQYLPSFSQLSDWSPNLSYLFGGE